RRTVECYFYETPTGSDTCETLAANWGIDVDFFTKLNPVIKCPTLESGTQYCVLGEYTPDAPGATTSTTSTITKPTPTPTPSTSKTSTTSTPPVSTFTPTLPGIATNCNRFYKIALGDICDTIVSKAGITLAQLRAWNTEINASCSNLWLGYYICTGVTGNTPITTTTTQPPATLTPTPTNTPTLPGAVGNCNAWYKVSSGDSCEVTAAKNTITVDQLRSWNTQLGSTCNDLWLGYYAYVGVPGAATPIPGIVSNYKRYTLVVSGDSCEIVSQRYGINVNDFKKWNTYINAQCTNIWLGALVC
ncbi:hypothetical protein B0T18DRAFT_306414, partial [Schizothecium vesticola]